MKPEFLDGPSPTANHGDIIIRIDRRAAKLLAVAAAAGLLALVGQAFPALADDILNVFQGGNAIRASEINANFDILHRRVGAFEEVMTITEDGRVGVGTDSPGAKLHVYSDAVGYPFEVSSSHGHCKITVSNGGCSSWQEIANSNGRYLCMSCN